MSISRLIQMGTAGVSAGGGGGAVWTDPDIANLSYDSVSLDLNLAANLRGMVFKPDGTKLYLAHDTGFDSIKEYTMSSAWDISTLSLNNSLNLTGVINATFGIYIKPDGSALYVVNSGSDRIERFNFSTNWDISTVSTPASQTVSITTNNNNPKGMFFKPDGTKMYVCGMGADGVVEYTLSTAWDITTASYQNLFSTATQSVYPSCVTFNEDGTRMYITTFSSSSDIFEYSLSTAWDVSTANYNSVSYNDSVLTNPAIHAFKSDGSKAYFIDDTDIIYQYSTAAVASSWTDPDIANASYDTVSFSVATQEPAPSGIFFKPDGTKMYVCGTTGSATQKVHEYDLSTAWDPSTATHNQSLNVSSVGASEASPQGIFFKNDGTKMFILGNTGDAVHEYTLSTAWDISSGSFVDSTTVSGQTTNPVSLCFKSDGTRLYTIALFGSQLYQYDLSTAWDASTMSYNNVVFDLDDPVNASAAKEVSFNPDGTKMWAIFDGGD
ncbi:hypothetical protein OAS61_00500, partial [Candidatus Thioglobus sp.]|nr:hypothetical protein [Candidatus Thioglobus sp.]